MGDIVGGAHLGACYEDHEGRRRERRSTLDRISGPDKINHGLRNAGAIGRPRLSACSSHRPTRSDNIPQYQVFGLTVPLTLAIGDNWDGAPSDPLRDISERCCDTIPGATNSKLIKKLEAQDVKVFQSPFHGPNGCPTEFLDQGYIAGLIFRNFLSLLQFKSYIWDSDAHLKSPEERALIRKLDFGILVVACLGFFLKYLE